jgi:hypothetical protein
MRQKGKILYIKGKAIPVLRHLNLRKHGLPTSQKSIKYAGIKTVNSLECKFTVLKNENAQFKSAVRKYLNVQSI